ncbi:cytidine deaminase, partial [Streptomyces sp. McG6]|nr:cytidine deaminase [Streptomyces sp. McG6]
TTPIHLATPDGTVHDTLTTT